MCIDYVDIAGRSSARGLYNQNTVGENGDFQPLHMHENISQTVSNAATVTIKH